ncbi:MAG TPA: YggS family pyridoxal phosphate-dependent enzyme [Ferruginibacter sp.]|nr:YggS family pyridoxal phosphate-dependent enzyme [Ferruginibacter sp.]HRO05277.1 YggS family pyridoxal phosphate-dependent enzyme [Ferruginibacter sp.]HRO96040.1 YggS family pyridoxal phosphate-dependent enzyme [Ferruginibacter sp.]HRP48627.1 YggS family pyridoxal phosphate-dependent enzyme [Ferruginibacter sp.]
MPFQPETYQRIISEIGPDVRLIAVSKLQPVQPIRDAYAAGHKDFGENYVQELVEKAAQLPEDIRWHFIGHLQSNKIKYIAPFVYLIHGVDSQKLLAAINKEAGKIQRTISCLLQVHVAKEETKHGFAADSLQGINAADYPNLKICGVMGMATFTDDERILQSEFALLKQTYDSLKPRFPEFKYLSMGMSGDYALAIQCGSNMVRIGSLLFGARPA